jgi:hypothetical protein
LDELPVHLLQLNTGLDALLLHNFKIVDKVADKQVWQPDTTQQIITVPFPQQLFQIPTLFPVLTQPTPTLQPNPRPHNQIPNDQHDFNHQAPHIKILHPVIYQPPFHNKVKIISF